MLILLVFAPDPLRHHGLRAHRRLPGGTVPHQRPLYLHVPALPHRQRLVRRLPSADRHRPATASVAAKQAFGANAIYAGLLYPVAIALVTLVVGGIFIKETRSHHIDTAVSQDASVKEIFDWWAVLAALALGFFLLLQWSSGFLPDLAAGKGFLHGAAGTTCGIRWSGPSACGPCRCLSLRPGVRAPAGRGHGAGLPGPHGPAELQALPDLDRLMGGTGSFFATFWVIAIYTAVLAFGFSFGRRRMAGRAGSAA